MIKSIADWIHGHAIGLFTIALVITCIYIIVSLVDVTRKPPTLDKFPGGIQNRIVWSISGECYFVRPYSNETVYLIRVQDCDKK